LNKTKGKIKGGGEDRGRDLNKHNHTEGEKVQKDEIKRTQQTNKPFLSSKEQLNARGC